ncbi:hypothetical protein LCGC14_3016830 [marine sediment metagenome]|uniref:Uncharacterized protein n=1 Tax=marine sediment metagenome TaxID=412755 RepID=A0A0F8Z445_9ZZZZ
MKSILLITIFIFVSSALFAQEVGFMGLNIGMSREEVLSFADDNDLIDDLFDREMSIRSEVPGVLPAGLEIERRVHISRGLDVRELYILIADADQDGFTNLEEYLNSLVKY